jgi:hypothetical protein
MKLNINKIIKIIFIIAMVVLIGILLSQTTYAEWTPDWGIYDNDVKGNASAKLNEIVGAIINIVSIVAAGIAIIMLIVIGVSYVINGAEGKADAKKSLESYTVGAVILFAASGILKLLQKFISGNINA